VAAQNRNAPAGDGRARQVNSSQGELAVLSADYRLFQVRHVAARFALNEMRARIFARLAFGEVRL
jgi:hypothetical protein